MFIILRTTGKNFTLHICFRQKHMNDTSLRWFSSKWTKFVTNLLQKKHHFNLTNFNILIDCTTLIRNYWMRNCRQAADWISDILKNNVNVLQHQFAQLNVGLCITQECICSGTLECKTCKVFQWNSSVDEKFLRGYTQFISNQSATDRESNVLKFRKLINQWVI